MQIVVASQSPVKKEAVRRGFVTLFPNDELTIVSLAANSGVSNQPMTLDEIRQGAIGRMNDAQKNLPGADFYVSLEGGVHMINENLYNTGWVIVDNGRKRGQAQTLGFALPQAVKDLIHSGMELSHAIDKLFATSDSKIGTGTIGPFTRDAITYTDWYTDAVIAALIPFVNPELYR